RSIHVTGKNPATDVYTVSARVDLTEVTALRLEVLPDKALASGGPGRSVNGNIVLTDVRLQAAGKDVKLGKASADFSQKDFPVANAIDDNPSTGWAIHPEVG